MNIIIRLRYTFSIFFLIGISSCAEFVDIDPPRTDLIKGAVFSSNETANAAALDMYYQLHFMGFASGDVSSISLIASLSTDELINGITFDQNWQQFNDNTLLPTNTLILSLWTDMYKGIYKANAIIEGLAASDGVTENLKNQLNGEAKFIRAFCYFYLVNLWSDVPLVLSTDYKVNQSIGRTPKDQVYDQIVSDLEEAKLLLSDDFSYSNNERVRANKDVATALLARVYLFLEDWTNADAQASAIIDNTSTYNLVPLNDVFLKNSNEAIWQLLPNTFGNTHDVETFLFYGHQINSQLMEAFEPGDQRKINWIENGVFGSYDYPVKYKDYNSTLSEYTVIFRLAEQYLIRAEARTQQNNISGAQDDLNSIRTRAGLGDTPAGDKASLLAAIEQERRVELFTEWGHRWFDLKRTGRVDAVLSPVKTDWESTDALYPIPEAQIMNDPTMRNSQNPGYN